MSKTKLGFRTFFEGKCSYRIGVNGVDHTVKRLFKKEAKPIGESSNQQNA
jgi:hypothetical protein